MNIFYDIYINIYLFLVNLKNMYLCLIVGNNDIIL